MYNTYIYSFQIMESQPYQPKIKVLMYSLDHISDWSQEKLAAPFWRIYWNRKGQSKLVFPNQTYLLNDQSILLIPPEVDFSSQSEKEIDHFYIHFQSIDPFRTMNCDVLSFDVSSNYLSMMESIIDNLKDTTSDNIKGSILSQSLVLLLLSEIDVSLLQAPYSDARVNASITTMHNNISTVLSNQQLAAEHNLNDNAYNQLFKKETGKTLQSYYTEIRIAESCLLLQFSNKTIESIAESTGFVDRFHYSRVFKKLRRVSPAKYRLQIT